MQNTNNNSILVNGKEITLAHDTQIWWVAIKPICDALNVDYIRQFKNLNEDKILSQLLSKQTTTGADGKQYKMVCLPEQYIYGWVFSLQSESEELQNFKMECYTALYNHFHSNYGQRVQLLKEKTATEKEIEKLQEELKQTDVYIKLVELQKTEKLIYKHTQRLDKEIVTQQLPLWESANEKGGAIC